MDSPPPYRPHRYKEVDEDVELQRSTERRFQQREPARGPSLLGWVIIILGCLVLSTIMIKLAYKEESSIRTDIAVRPTSSVSLHVKRISLNPLKSFTSGNAGVKVGLIVGGVSTFNTGVRNCDDGKWFSCVTGIITGLLLAAAGAWAPVPGRRDLGHANRTLEVDFSNVNKAAAFNTIDASSTHPADLFVLHYSSLVEAHPEYLNTKIGYVHYHNLGTHHRLIISPRQNFRRGDQDGNENDGGSVSYQWTDFGASADGVDKNQDDYSNVAGGVTQYLQDNQSNNICLSQCNGALPYEIGQLQTQSGTNPDYDDDCQFSDDMDGC